MKKIAKAYGVASEIDNWEAPSRDTLKRIFKMFAFLSHGKEPPDIQAHFHAMTREIEKTKNQLHRAVKNELFETRTEIKPKGFTRSITREALGKTLRNSKLKSRSFFKT